MAAVKTESQPTKKRRRRPDPRDLTEEQRVERRERNREHAKRSRIRKKFLLESLQDQVRCPLRVFVVPPPLPHTNNWALTTCSTQAFGTCLADLISPSLPRCAASIAVGGTARGEHEPTQAHPLRAAGAG